VIEGENIPLIQQRIVDVGFDDFHVVLLGEIRHIYIVQVLRRCWVFLMKLMIFVVNSFISLVLGLRRL